MASEKQRKALKIDWVCLSKCWEEKCRRNIQVNYLKKVRIKKYFWMRRKEEDSRKRRKYYRKEKYHFYL